MDIELEPKHSAQVKRGPNRPCHSVQQHRCDSRAPLDGSSTGRHARDRLCIQFWALSSIRPLVQVREEAHQGYARDDRKWRESNLQDAACAASSGLNRAPIRVDRRRDIVFANRHQLCLPQAPCDSERVPLDRNLHGGHGGSNFCFESPG